MAKLKLYLDTNVVIDYLDQREGFYEDAKLLMICGRVGEFELKICSSQWTDLVYILSNGGRKSELPQVLQKLRGLRTFIGVSSVGENEIDGMLRTSWDDAEDSLIYECALRDRADAIITRNQTDYKDDLVLVMSCEEFFSWLEEEKGLVYEEVPF